MNAFTNLLEQLPEYQTILKDISYCLLPMGIQGLAPVPKANLISSLCQSTKSSALVLVPDESTAHKMTADLCAFGARAAVYPARDFAFRTTEVKSYDFEHKRLAVLSAILDGEIDICVSSIEAAAQFTIPPEDLKRLSLTLRLGEELSIHTVCEALLCADYTRVEMVDGTGQFAVRGGILDFFPPEYPSPVRMEFWGDTIDSIAHFDIVSQRRGEPIEEIKISPASEIVFPSIDVFREKLEKFYSNIKGRGAVRARESIQKDLNDISFGVKLGSVDKYISLAYDRYATIFDYLKDGLIFVCETAGVKEKFHFSEAIFHEQIKTNFEDGVLFKGLDTFTLDFSQILHHFLAGRTLYLDNFSRGSFDTPVKDLIMLNASQTSCWEGSLSVLLDDIRPALSRGVTPIIFAGTEKAASALSQELIDEKIHAAYFATLPEQFIKGTVNILTGGISASVEYPSLKAMIITYGRGRSAMQKHKNKVDSGYKAGQSFHSLNELRRGDYVVHTLHGIGIFDGIVKMDASGVMKDYIKINYAANDVLYVPVNQLDLVSKYVSPKGDDTKKIKINRLGSKDWEKTKNRVRTAVKEMAEELLVLYSKRMKTPGYAFSPDIDMQSDFERRFEYDETDDQLRCIAEIKHDMEMPHPMDRLLCGDVGFGKTEVALRAAFKCAADGKQCAILVPTTILAFQHYQTILKRMEGFPINVEMISRYRNRSEQEKILEKLRRGNIDIIVGTHRLISADVKFHDLGLLIIDEEQRFGVAQKEKLKSLFPNVDVLTMSATPIPRTLNMAMTGIRDMSVIEEAPSDRLPIQSYVVEYDSGVIAEAIDRELRRGGQVYYLHNKIEDIEKAAARVQAMAPEASVGIAHGRMNEEEISDVWQMLLNGEIDILVCTTIIETGIDVPNCNTLIIEDANAMGLAQLHQIRGRVGRSSRRASAFFTFKKGKQLSEVAQRRLDAIREFTQFGSGFKIAMRDLEIRGAGNILGSQQHGHMEAVGYDMYLKLLSEAVKELEKQEDAEEAKKAAKKKIERECLIDIRLDAHIPEEYIESVPQRLGIYRRIAEIQTQEDVDDVMDELLDRFGEPPESVKGLLTVSLLRNSAANQGIYEISQRDNNILFFVKQIEKSQVSKLASAMHGRIMVSAAEKPYITVKKAKNQSSLDCLKEVFRVLSLKDEKKDN